MIILKLANDSNNVKYNFYNLLMEGNHLKSNLLDKIQSKTFDLMNVSDCNFEKMFIDKVRQYYLE